MRTKFAILMTAGLLLFSFMGQAQALGNHEVKIGELVLGQSYTEAQIAEITDSEPVIIQSGDSLATILRFSYKGNAFYTLNGTLHCFEINNDKLKFNGIVGVGDSFDKVAELNLILFDSNDGTDGVTYYYAYTMDDTQEQNPITFFVRDNIIFTITYLNERPTN